MQCMDFFENLREHNVKRLTRRRDVDGPIKVLPDGSASRVA